MTNYFEQDIDISINLDAASKMLGEVDLRLSKTNYQYTNLLFVLHILFSTQISIFRRFENHLLVIIIC